MTRPTITPRAQAALEERRAREAAALRENLRRRKEQGRHRLAQEGSKEGQGAALDPPGGGGPLDPVR